MTRCNANPNHMYRLKRVEILHHLIQPIFSEASQYEWCKHLIVQPDFPVLPCKFKGVKVYFEAFSFVRNSVCG